RRELLLVAQGRELERAEHRALVGDTDADALAEAAAGEQLAKRLAEGALVRDFAVTDGVGGERQRCGLLGQDRTVYPRLDGGDETRLDVQAGDVHAGAAREVQVEVDFRGGKSHFGGSVRGLSSAARGVSAEVPRRFS